jgi:hypothetical protein
MVAGHCKRCRWPDGAGEHNVFILIKRTRWIRADGEADEKEKEKKPSEKMERLMRRRRNKTSDNP